MKNRYKSIKEKLRATNDIISGVDDCWYLWKEISLKEKNMKYSNVLDKYFGFWTKTRHAYLFYVIVSIAKLFDRGKDVVSFKELIKGLKKQRTNHQELDKVELILNDCTKTKDGVEKIRNNLYAHLNKESISRDFFAEANVSPDDISELICNCKQIMTIFWEMVNESLMPVGDNHFEQLMEALMKKETNG